MGPKGCPPVPTGFQLADVEAFPYVENRRGREHGGCGRKDKKKRAREREKKKYRKEMEQDHVTEY